MRNQEEKKVFFFRLDVKWDMKSDQRHQLNISPKASKQAKTQTSLAEINSLYGLIAYTQTHTHSWVSVIYVFFFIIVIEH